MIKQPALGKKITELRKSKGLTQEELVERCNISVRTIQRIETGEVTPRSYTLKTILSALDHDLKDVSEYDLDHNTEDESGSGKVAGLKSLMLMEVDEHTPADVIVKQLTIAWMFGLLYFVLSFVEAPIEYLRLREDELAVDSSLYILLKIILLISLFFFQRGIFIIGSFYGNYLLKIMCLGILGAHFLLIVTDIASVFSNSIDPELVMYPASILFGVLGVGYGFALRRQEKTLGRAAELAGIFEIVSGLCFLTIVLAILGEILHVPAELFEIVVIYKMAGVVRKNETSKS
jgi:transcriptional regulator with XRE-family HTH domain